MALQDILSLPRNPKFNFFDSDPAEDAVTDEFNYSRQMLPIARLPASRVSLMSTNGMFVDETGRKICINHNRGTTTLAFRYKGGICVAVDSRATSGQYIGSGSVRKIIVINKHLLGTMAGGAADCTYWERMLSRHCRMHELRNREPISVAAASKLLSNMLYNYKGMGLSLGVMISGWDKKGPGLFYVDNDCNRFPGDLFSVGSGSTYAYGVLDSQYRYDMEDEEAYELARKAIYHATYRDIASGGVVRVWAIKETGWEVITEDDCKDLHYKYQDEKMA